MPRAARSQQFLVDPLAVTRDPVRRAMGPAAQGVYDTLWLESWMEKVPGVLPADEALLARLAQVSDAIWLMVRDEVRTGFDMSAGKWVCRAVLRVKREQDSWRTHWRKQKQAQRLRGADKGRTSATTSSDGSGSGTGTGSGAGSGTRKIKDSCSERFASSPPPSPLALQALTGEWWTPSEVEAAEWARAYPAVALEQQVAAMRAWLAANKSRRKTLRGLPRFAAQWLGREQDRPRPNGDKPSTLGDNGLPIDGSDGWGTPATWRRGTGVPR